MLKKLIDFLTPFKEITDILEASKRPTLHRVVPCRRGLLEKLKANATEPQFVVEYKEIAESLVKDVWVLHSFHRIAYFLNPKMRSLKALSYSEQDDTMDNIRQILSEIHLPSEVLPNASAPLEHSYENTSGPQSKRRRTGLEEAWEDDDDEAHSTVSSVSSELETYRNLSPPADAEFDLLGWWKLHAAQLPRLSRLAKRVLAIPATSAPSERNFSAAGQIVNKLRTKLNPKNVEDLLVLRSNLDLMK